MTVKANYGSIQPTWNSSLLLGYYLPHLYYGLEFLIKLVNIICILV